MKLLGHCITGIILLTTLASLNGKEVQFRSSNGQKLTLEVDSHEPFNEVVERVGFFFNNRSWMVNRAAEDHMRDYDKPATKKQADMITYVVTTMGFKGYADLWRERKALKATKEPLIDLHPFRFLEVIFTGEETKAAISNVKDKKFVWPEFKNGLYPSLTEEAAKGNLKIKDVKDFAKNVKVDSKLLIPAIEKKDWDQLVNVLIDNVPREGNPNHYDM